MQQSCVVRRCPRGVVFGILLLLLIACPMSVSRVVLPPETPLQPEEVFLQVPLASETITRRQAVLRYASALYSPDGYFHGFLDAPPLEGKLGLYPSAEDVDDGYTIFEMLDATGDIDWTPSISLLRSLVNGPSSSEEFRGLINATTGGYWPNALSMSTAVYLFDAFGIIDELDLDRIAGFVSQCQRDSGGLCDSPDDSNPPDLIATCFGVKLLAKYGYLDLIDVDRVAEFVRNCQKEDGGFSLVVGSTSRSGVMPLALMTLEAIDRRTVIDTNMALRYLLGQWDNTTGCHIYGDIVSTERAIWCFSLLSALDLIDQRAAVNWTLRCQSQKEGAFRVVPGDESDRLWFCRVAVHALSLLGRLDALDSLITVWETPEWHTPQWYLDKIASETTSTSVPFVWWSLDLSAVLNALWPIALSMLCASPAIYWNMNERSKRSKLRSARLERRRLSSH